VARENRVFPFNRRNFASHGGSLLACSIKIRRRSREKPAHWGSRQAPLFIALQENERGGNSSNPRKASLSQREGARNRQYRGRNLASRGKGCAWHDCIGVRFANLPGDRSASEGGMSSTYQKRGSLLTTAMSQKENFWLFR